MSFLFGDVVDVAADRLVQWLTQPVRIRRGLAELRGPRHSMRCSVQIRSTAVPGIDAHWLDGRAVLEPGWFSFHARGRPAVRLEVQAVVESTETRCGQSSSAGSRSRAVWQLRTTEGIVKWSAHEKLLSEGARLLRAGDALPR